MADDTNPYMQFVPKGHASPSNPYMDLAPQKPWDAAWRGVTQWGEQRGRNLQDAMEWIGGNPLARGASAVLGTTERAGVSGASALLDVLSGHKPTTNPVAGVFNPEGDIEATHKLEHQELDKPLAAYNALGIPRNPAPSLMVGLPSQMHIPAGGAGRAVLDYLTQSGHDITTIVPGVDIFTLLGRAARFAHAGEAAGKMAGAFGKPIGKVVPEEVKAYAAKKADLAKSGFSSSYKHLKGYQQPGLNIQRAREGEMRFLQMQRQREYEEALAPLKPGIEQLDATLRARGIRGIDLKGEEGRKLFETLPLWEQVTLNRVNRITDKALWRDATPEVRRKMRARGFKPTPEEAALPPTNLISTDFGERYLPEQTLYDKAAADEAAQARGFRYNRGGLKRSKFDVEKTGATATDPLFERLVGRLESSAYLEPKRRMEQRLISDLGLTPSQAPRTMERMQDLRERLAVTPKGTPEHERILKTLPRYQALLGRQTRAAYEAEQKRAKYLQPGAAMTEANLPGVLRGEKTAQQIAARDLGFLGQETAPALSAEGKLLSRPTLGPTIEKAKARAGEAYRTQLTENAAKKAARKSMESLGKEKAGVEGAIGKGQARLAKQAEEGYNKGLKAHSSLTEALKKEPGLGQDIATGYARSGHGILDLPGGGFAPETQRVLSRRGQVVRGKMDPAFEALRKATTGQRVAAPFTDVVKATARLQGKRTTTPLEKLTERLGKSTVKRQGAAHSAAEELAALRARDAAVKAMEGRVAADPLYQGKITMPSAAHERIFGPKVSRQPTILDTIAGLQRQAMFTWPLPHGVGNVGEQQTLAGGGLGASLAGVRESERLARQDPEAIKRLEEAQRHGATYEHGYESPVTAKHPLLRGAQSLQHVLQRNLTRGEQGQISALFHKYVEGGMSPEDAAEEVRKTFGRPHEQSDVSKALGPAGAPFAKWVLETVPRSAAKMVTTARGRNALKSFARADQDVNADVFEPEYGVEFHPGGFAERAMTAAFDPLRYLGTRSIEGALTDIGEQGGRGIGNLWETFVPGYGQLQDLARQPLKSHERLSGGYKKLPAAARATSLLGSYFTKAETPRHQLMRELYREGLLKKTNLDDYLKGF